MTRRMMNISLNAAVKVDNYSCSSSSSNKEEEEEEEESPLIPPPLTLKQLSLSAAIARPASTSYNEKTTIAKNRPTSVTMSRVEAASGSSTDDAEALTTTTTNTTAPTHSSCHDDMGMFGCSVPSACYSVPMVRMEATSGIGRTYKEEEEAPMMMSAPMVRCKGQLLHEAERLVSSELA
ncbi:hypothetical protein FRC17_001877 [Serendipita sp. 399]|nr:hypothetical protein FRC17_001877 [Serendipita sp. 399]